MKTTTLFGILISLIGAAFNAQAAPKSSASFEKALDDAQMIASLNPAWSVHRTSGDSMDDYFGDNSLILVQPATLADVQVGMMIVYRSTGGELISHKVVQHDGEGVRTQGVSNRNLDPEPVTDDRIVGIIFAVFHAADAPAGEVHASDGQPIPTALCKNY
ncbi:MAG: hypothetical protein ACLFVC_05720 [Opitutales bacterium]